MHKQNQSRPKPNNDCIYLWHLSLQENNDTIITNSTGHRSSHYNILKDAKVGLYLVTNDGN